MKKYISVLTFFFLSKSILAQNYVDIARVYYNSTPINYFEKSNSGTRLTEFGLDLTVPIVINSSDALLTGLICERIQTKLFESNPEQNVSVMGTRIGWSRKHSTKWSGTYMLLPKLASDFKTISGKDFQLGAIALMKYTKREDLHYKLGIYYNSELFGPFIVPLFGLYHLSVNKKFETNLTLPFLADVNYKLHTKLNVGMNFSGQIRSYHLNETPAGAGAYLVKTTNELTGYLKFNLNRELSVQTRIGFSLGRSYRVYDEADQIKFGSVLMKIDDDRQQLNTDFSNGFVYQTILLYRFVRDK